ncbi:hypothetical protein [Streptomyces tubercidicus]|uniref:hypothetical protein n=1 Tax=Streptomyces tubercidicus TaxID=47759 RepID=UPI0036C25797
MDRSLLLHCRRRGIRVPVLAAGDGALGFSKALTKTFREQVPEVLKRHQRRTPRLASQIGSVVRELAR